MRKPRPYPTEITEDAWAVGAPYLTVIATQAPQRHYDFAGDVQRLGLDCPRRRTVAIASH